MVEKYKSTKGITLVALVVTIVILLILAGISINMLMGDNGIIAKAKEAKEKTETAQQQEQTSLESVLGKIEEAMGTQYDKDKKINKPQIVTGMTPIKFTEPTDTEKGTTSETNSSDNDWYNYEAKKWANTKTQDGSMWVWIPRYAYKVNSTAKTFDIVFLIGTTDNYYDAEGKIQTAKRAKTADEIVDTTTGYTVHPAFTNESSINYANGGWDKELSGIWVAKFEAGYASGNNNTQVKASSVNYSQTTVWAAGTETGGSDGSLSARNWLDGIYGSTQTAIKYPTFQGTTYAMNYINHNDSYNISKVLNESGNIYGLSSDSDSHLMKNSEWGAVAYLSQSKYGLNGTNIYINNVNLNNSTTSVYAVTGCSATSENASANKTTIANINATTGNTVNNNTYTWNQKNGQKASSSGTIYGIYDLSGGTWERTAAYVANGNGNLKTYGASIAYEGNTLKTVSTKYTTVYPSNDSGESNIDTASQKNYALNKKIYGDGIRETSTAGTGSTSWYGDYSYFPALHVPFSFRGGFLWFTSNAGLFYFYRSNGSSSYYNGFRPVVFAQ